MYGNMATLFTTPERRRLPFVGVVDVRLLQLPGKPAAGERPSKPLRLITIRADVSL